MALKRCGCAKAENQTVDFIFIGVVSLRHVLKIRCGGKIFVEPVAGGEAEFRIELIGCGGSKAQRHLERKGAATVIDNIIAGLVLVGTGRHSVDGKLVIEVISHGARPA